MAVHNPFPLILYRYLMREMVPSFLVGLFTLTIVLIMGRVLRVVEWIVEKGIPFIDVMKMFVSLLPSLFVLTLPMALLLSVLLTFSRMYADNELCALKAAGFGLYRLLPPVYFCGALVTAASLILTTWVGPQSTRVFASVLYSVAMENAFFGVKERVFFDNLPGLVVYFEHLDPAGDKAEGIFIEQLGMTEDPIFYSARHGNLYGDPDEGRFVVELFDGVMHNYEPSRDLYRVARFDKYQVLIDMKVFMPATQQIERRDMKELTLSELDDVIRGKVAQGEEVRKYSLNYHQRLALPFGAFVFCTLGIPLSLLSQRAVRYTGFSLGIGVILLYYVLMQVGTSIVYAGVVPPVVGVWIPNVALGAVGAYLLRRKAQEKPLKILDRYAQAVQDLQDFLRERFQATTPQAVEKRLSDHS